MLPAVIDAKEGPEIAVEDNPNNAVIQPANTVEGRHDKNIMKVKGRPVGHAGESFLDEAVCMCHTN